MMRDARRASATAFQRGLGALSIVVLDPAGVSGRKVFFDSMENLKTAAVRVVNFKLTLCVSADGKSVRSVV